MGFPQHVAIIMDGNGRWAADRGRSRSKGHKAGVDAADRTVEAAAELGIKHLSLYAFSTENWKRPAEEVSGSGLTKRGQEEILDSFLGHGTAIGYD